MRYRILPVVVWVLTGVALMGLSFPVSAQDVNCDSTQQLCVEIEPGATGSPVTQMFDGGMEIDAKDGSVILRYKETTISGKRLQWTDADQTAVISGDVKIERNDSTMTSDTITASVGDDTYHLTGSVRAVQKDEAGKVTRTITAQEMLYTGATGDMRATEQVLVEDAQRRVTASEAVYSDAAQEIVFTGHVSVESSDPQGHFQDIDRMQVDLKTNKAVMLGAWKGGIEIRESSGDTGQQQ